MFPCLNFLLVLLFSCFFDASFGLCHDDDYSSLLLFKESFLIDELSCDSSTDFTKLETWKVGKDCCSWDGVHCDEKTGRVIWLDISSSCLFGSIDSSSPLFRLHHLVSLNISGNNFNLSSIPFGIGSLSRLERLDLSFSNFSGQVPSKMLDLSSLVSLDLCQNSNLILQKPSLEDVVEAFANLNELHLSGIQISSLVPHSLSKLTSLTSLHLDDCSLQGNFPEDVFWLPNLRFLRLEYNPKLTGYIPEFEAGSRLEVLMLDGTNFAREIPVSIGKLNSLRIFSASECSFFGSIPSSIGNLTKLNILDLSYNYLSRDIPSSLGNLLWLTDLSLSYNNFSSGTLHWLGTLSNLRSLGMVQTNTVGPIPSSFENMTQLTSLRIFYNRITGQIPSWLGNLTEFSVLRASMNKLQGPIPESIFRLPNLQVLNVQVNNLSGSIKYDSFLQSKNLVSFQISYNRLSVVRTPYTNISIPKFQYLGLRACNLREIPSFLPGQNQLVLLSLSENKIEGYVPKWLFTLKSLRFLFLEHNNLIGFKPPLGVLQLTNLQIMNITSNGFRGPLPIPPPLIAVYDVSQNKFSGEISPQFSNLTSALVLDLSSNNLSGKLPPCLCKLGSSMLVLVLSNNSLSGKVPDKFRVNCTLKLIDFSQNEFYGNMPKSLAYCSKLEIINFEKNQINDVFPWWLGVLPQLQVLSLRSNKFQGAIGSPRHKLEFGQLQIIDLSDNNFTGKLPEEYLRNWVAMKTVNNDRLAYMQADTSFEIPGFKWTLNYKYSITIVNKGTERSYDRILEFFVVVDLSSNGFEGEIPNVVGTLSELQSLNLSNNILKGHIPLSLGNLTKLEALDLSRNNLSGDIPVQLAFLTFLATFNVSHNSLTGPIPRGNQFNTFDKSSFAGNPGLCGDVLLKKCGNIDTSLLPHSRNDDDDGRSPFEFCWEVVLSGCGTGLVIGVAFGCALDTRKYQGLAKKFRRLRRRRIN